MAYNSLQHTNTSLKKMQIYFFQRYKCSFEKIQINLYPTICNIRENYKTFKANSFQRFYKNHTIADCFHLRILLLPCLWENRVQEIPKLCAICCLTDWYRTQLLTFFNSTKNSSHMFSNFKTDVLQVFLQPFCKTISARLFLQDYFCKTIPSAGSQCHMSRGDRYQMHKRS